MDLHAGFGEVELCGVEEQRLVDFSNTLKLLEEEFRDIEDSREIIMGVLQAAGSYYQADRVYVLEMDVELQIGINTYEWCSEHTPEAIVHSQWIPLELIPRLEQYLKKNKPMIIENISDIQENYPQEYSELLSQGITSMIAAPFSKRIKGLLFMIF